jgi:hypothetical protein
MADVIVDQRFLGVLDRTLDGLQLLSDLRAWPALFPPVRSAIGGAHEGVDGIRSFRSRFAGDPVDGIHMDEDLILVAAIGVGAKGDKHPLGLIEGATENAATVQALIDDRSLPLQFPFKTAAMRGNGGVGEIGPAAADDARQVRADRLSRWHEAPDVAVGSAGRAVGARRGAPILPRASDP